MTTREIVAAFLIFIGAQSAASSVLYIQVVGGNTFPMLGMLLLGVALVSGGIAVLKYWRE